MKPSLRVYFVNHVDGRITGILLRTWDWFFDRRPPSAYGTSEDDVYEQLEAQLHAMAATEEDSIERYLWDESFELRSIEVEVHPQTTVKKRTVIGKRRIPLTITYLFSKVPGGGYRVMIPRFGWRFILEDLSVAPAVLRQAVSTALLGQEAKSLYDFREEGAEYVREWAPRLTQSAAASRREEEEFPTLRAAKRRSSPRSAPSPRSSSRRPPGRSSR